MKTKLLLLSLIFLSTVGASAQVLELLPTAPGNTKVIKTSVSNGVASTFQWTENDPLNIISGATGNADSITIVASPSATDGQTATVSVKAISNSASCMSDPKTLNILIRNPGNVTFIASFGTAPAPICQGSSAPFSITFNRDSVVSYYYFIDLDNNGTLSGSETLITKTLAAPGSSDNLNVTFNTNGNIPVVISFVSGIAGGQTITSGQSGVSQSVTVDAKPVLGNFSY